MFTVSLVRGIYHPQKRQIIVRHRYGVIYFFVDDKYAELTTIDAHKVGMAIMKATPEKDEMFEIRINNEPLVLLAPDAIKVATALLRKADDADDWQLQRRKQ